MYTAKKLDGNKFEIKISATKEEWEAYVEKAYDQTKDKFNIEGFRKGKAPRAIIEKNYGTNVFFDEAIDMFFTEEYHNALRAETDINPIDNPQIRIDKFDDSGMVIIAEVEVAPEVKLGQYKNLEIKKATGSVGDEEVNAELEGLRQKQARFVEAQRAAKIGDVATIDFVGSTDGVEFEGGAAENHRLELGSHSFIDTFEDQIVGMELGQSKDVNVTFPKEYHSADLAGKPALFVVTLKKLEEKELPVLDDEFASNASEFETLEELKADIKKHLEESLEVRLKRQDENTIIDAIVKASEVALPEVMIQRQLDAFMDDIKMRLSYQGIELEEYAKMANINLEEMRNERKEQAEKVVKTRLVLEEIIKTHNLFVTDEELDGKLAAVSGKSGKELEEYKKQMGDRNVAYVENELLMDKLMAFLTENNKLA